MSIDISSNLRALGINVATGTNQVSSSSVSNAGVKAPKPSTGMANVASSVGKFTGGVISGIGKGIAKGFNDTAHGITQGLPGIGSIAQNQRINDAARRQINQAHTAYAKDFASGKITKDRYNKLLRQLGKQYSEVSGQANENTKTVSPKDFAVGLATVATSPLAAGKLVQGGRLGSIATKLPKVLGAAEKSRSLPVAALLAPAKSALMYQPTAQAGAEIPGQVKRGDLAGAAGNAALLASPAIIGAAGKILPKLGKVAEEAVYGKASFLDDIPTKDMKITQFISSLKGAEKAKYETRAKVFQEHNLGESQGQIKAANAKYLDWVGRDKAANMTAKEHLDLHAKFVTDVERTREAARAGTLPKPGGGTWTEDEIQNLWVGRFDQGVKSKLIDRLKTIEDPAERSAVAAKMADKEQWGKNTILRDQVIAAAEQPNFEKTIGKLQGTRSLVAPTEKQTKIMNIQKGQVKDVEGQATLDAVFGKKKELRLNQGHIPILRDKIKTQLPGDVSKVDLQAGKEAAPILGAIGKGLEKAGLSTQSQDPAVYGKYKTYLGDELKKVGLDVNDVTDKLNQFAQKNLEGIGVFDERQLGTYAMKRALDTTDSKQADAVRNAIFKAYDRMTWGDLSAAGKIENALYKVPGYGVYRRIQGVGRYQGNPLFRLQSNVEAELLSQNVAKGKTPALPFMNNISQKMFRASSDELDSISKKITDKFGEGFAGEGAADTSYGIISAKLTRTQKNSVAGLVKTLTEKGKYKDVDDFLTNADSDVLNNIREVVQYSQTGFTSSNFAKTMNMLIFPSRYNTKLAMIAGKSISQMPPLMQIGTLKGLSDFSNFLETDQGIKWKAENSEVIGILSYLNPAGNIGKVFQGIKTGNFGISDLGVIGGLPLGVFTQMLKSQTGISTNQPYLNPKTGELVPDKLPATTSGALKLLIIDMVNSMYSFPGRTFGAGISKSNLTQSLPGIKLNKDDTKNKEQLLNKNQKHIQRVLTPKNTTSSSKSVSPTKRFATTYGQNEKAFPSFSGTLTAPTKTKKVRVKPKAFRPRPI